MHAAAALIALYSILLPVKSWYAPDQPIMVRVVPGEAGPITLVLTDFSGRIVEGRGQLDYSADATVNVSELFQQLETPGTYVLWAVPAGRLLPEFVGTPLLLSVREDRRIGAPPGPMITRVSPLCVADVTTDKGAFTLAFFYDVAPHTVNSFAALAVGGFYDGLTFHRIVPGFIIQGGDPRGDGTGGPGYQLAPEFSDREMREGVVAMARQNDPLEAQGAMPRAEAANSAGSQFFICLDYERTQQLDGRYTAFARVVDGMDVVKSLAASPVEGERPVHPPVIKEVRLRPVTGQNNPYSKYMNFNLDAAATQKTR